MNVKEIVPAADTLPIQFAGMQLVYVTPDIKGLETGSSVLHVRF